MTSNDVLNKIGVVKIELGRMLYSHRTPHFVIAIEGESIKRAARAINGDLVRICNE